jgi:hypothetical protein
LVKPKTRTRKAKITGIDTEKWKDLGLQVIEASKLLSWAKRINYLFAEDEVLFIMVKGLPEAQVILNWDEHFIKYPKIGDEITLKRSNKYGWQIPFLKDL